MTELEQQVLAVIAPVVEPLDLEVYDVEHAGGTLRIALDREGGPDLEAITQASRAISHALDAAEVLTARYTLEVSTPGLERRLRRPEHFQRAVGSQVTVKLRPEAGEERRLSGTLLEARDDALVVAPDDPADEARVVALDLIDTVRTVFSWEPTPKPGSAGTRTPHKRVTTT